MDKVTSGKEKVTRMVGGVADICAMLNQLVTKINEIHLVEKEDHAQVIGAVTPAKSKEEEKRGRRHRYPSWKIAPTATAAVRPV